jgi:hypothetical protein
MKSIRFVALAVVVTAGIGGCASTTGTPSSTPAAGTFTSAPAVPGQQRETGLVRPALVFDGDCGALFSASELQSTMGESMELTNNHFRELWAGDAVFNQYGGFECTWRGEHAQVVALVLPEAAVTYSPAEYACGPTHDAEMSCYMDSVVNGIRLSGLTGRSQDGALSEAARDALLAIFAEKAALQPPAVIPLPAIGSWPLPSGCTAADGADFSTVPGLGAGAVDAGPPGYGKDVTQAEWALGDLGFSPSCMLMGESADIEYAAIGGARWREQAIAARSDATVLDLDGVEAAYAVPYGTDMTLIYAFSGPNMLEFSVRYTKNAAAIATAFFASLDATAVN